MKDPIYLMFDDWCHEFFDALDKYEEDFGVEVYPVKNDQAFTDLLSRLYQEQKTPTQAVDVYVNSIK